jgi:hypothetical protein
MIKTRVQGKKAFRSSILASSSKAGTAGQINPHLSLFSTKPSSGRRKYRWDENAGNMIYMDSSEGKQDKPFILTSQNERFGGGLRIY